MGSNLYVDQNADYNLDVKQVTLNAEEIILSFDYPHTDSIINKMNKRTLEVFYEHINDLKLRIEKKLFEET